MELWISLSFKDLCSPEHEILVKAILRQLCLDLVLETSYQTFSHKQFETLPSQIIFVESMGRVITVSTAPDLIFIR